MIALKRALVALAALLMTGGALPAQASEAPTLPALAKCQPTGPCKYKIPVKVVVISLFEIGADTGDALGEFQLWRERRHLDTRIPFPQGYHDLFYNPDSQILGMVTGIGTARSAGAAMALGLDQRFDLSHAYFLVAGIAGIDPEDASIGSAAWARWLVDGDLAHEIDAREIPADWKYGYFPRYRNGPNDPRPAEPTGEVFELNRSLVDWAFNLTKDVKLPDDPEITAMRARYTGFPNAQKPPFVLEGEQLSAMTFWHGKLLNEWANDWVRYWTHGKGEFVTSAMEDTGIMQSMTYLDHAGRVDKNRVLVLRAGSNYTMPPPGVSAADNLLSENKGYSGLRASVESLYLVGGKVVDELLAHWDKYEAATPQ